MQFICYLDESGTHGGDGGKNPASPFMVMGGHVARLGQWNRFDRQWRKHLASKELEYLHAAEFSAGKHRKARPELWREDEENRFLLKTGKILERHTLFGLTVRLSLDDYEKHYVIKDKPRKLRLDTPYGLCFRTIASFVPQLIQEYENPKDLRLNFVLEDGHDNIGDALRIHKDMRDGKVTGVSEYLGEFNPAPKKRFPGLQAADTVVWGVRDEDISVATVRQPPRTLSTEKAFEDHKSPIIRLTLDQKILPELRDKMLGWAEARKRFGEQKYGTKAR